MRLNSDATSDFALRNKITYENLPSQYVTGEKTKLRIKFYLFRDVSSEDVKLRIKTYFFLKSYSRTHQTTHISFYYLEEEKNYRGVIYSEAYGASARCPIELMLELFHLICLQCMVDGVV